MHQQPRIYRIIITSTSTRCNVIIYSYSSTPGPVFLSNTNLCTAEQKEEKKTCENSGVNKHESLKFYIKKLSWAGINGKFHQTWSFDTFVKKMWMQHHLYTLFNYRRNAYNKTTPSHGIIIAIISTWPMFKLSKNNLHRRRNNFQPLEVPPTSCFS